nr:hypothetical protein [Tanacetum cinerariifolium]
MKVIGRMEAMWSMTDECGGQIIAEGMVAMWSTVDGHGGLADGMVVMVVNGGWMEWCGKSKVCETLVIGDGKLSVRKSVGGSQISSSVWMLLLRLIILNSYAFLASRLQSAGLQTKLLQHTSFVSPKPIFDDALSLFNTSMETDHHDVSSAGIIGIKHRHNVVRDTLFDICHRSGISDKADAVIFLKRIQKFFMAQDFGARDAVHILNRISVAIAKGFGVGVAGGSEAILYSMNRLIEACVDDVGLSMLLVDFKNAFNLVDQEVLLREGDPLGLLLFSLVVHPLICKIRDYFSLSLHAWFLDDGTIVEDIVVVGKVLELVMEDGLYFTMCACPPRVLETAQRSFDVDLRSSLERIIIASGPGFDDWQWRLSTLPFAFGGLGVYNAGDVLNYAFLASRLQSAGLQTKLL